jgi:transposase
MESIGIDVHKVNSQICVVGENAEVLEERRIQTDRERFAAVLGKRPKARVLIEASTSADSRLGKCEYQHVVSGNAVQCSCG